MKNFTLTLLVCSSLIFLQTSCKSSSTVKSVDTSNSASSSESTVNNTEQESVAMTNPGNVSTAAQYNGSSGGNVNVLAASESSAGNSDTADADMYTYLGMTSEQISRLETEIERFKKQMVNDPNGEMRGTVDSERERQLKEILTAEQLDKYYKWQVEN